VSPRWGSKATVDHLDLAFFSLGADAPELTDAAASRLNPGRNAVPGIEVFL